MHRTRKRTASRDHRNCRRSTMEMLEARELLSAADPSGQEQELLWLLNRMRTHPAEELPLLLNTGDAYVQQALTYFNVDRTMLASQWASLTPVAPVAWNSSLGTSAAAHNDAMAAADQQAHQVPGEPDPATRINNAGYDFTTAGENVYAFAYTMIHTHAAFAIDWGNGPGGIQSPAGHRIDMMNGAFRDVGIAVLQHSGVTTGPYLVTQDFGQPAAAMDWALVGTVYKDANSNAIYNAGEGLAGVTVTAAGAAGVFTTQSLTAGGYQLALPNGSYAVTFTGTGVPGGKQTLNVTVNGQNVLQDFETSLFGGVNPPPTQTATPIGTIDAVEVWPSGAPRSLSGWAADVDAGNNGDGAIQVRLDVDGKAGTPTVANGNRPDLLGMIGSTSHGYRLDVPALAPGLHVLDVMAMDVPTGAWVRIGRRVVNTRPSVFGMVDGFGTTAITGWAFDPGAANGGGDPVQVRLDIDGVAGTPIAAANARADLTGLFGTPNHGFSMTIPTLPLGPHRFEVYAIGADGNKVLIGRKTYAVSTRPVGSLDIANTGAIAGWAMDPDSPGSPATVRIDVDGATFRTVTTSIKRPDLAPLGPAAFAFNVLSPAFAAGRHVINVYAIDDRSRQAVLFGTRVLNVAVPVNRLPIGLVDTLTAGGVSGWAVDPDDQASAVQVRVVVDGVALPDVPATTARPDLAAYVVGANHGFSISLDTLTTGSHRVDVFALDLQTAALTLLGGGLVTV